MSLTSELEDPRSPISRWMQDQFPWTRDVLAEYRLAAPDLSVSGKGANPGTTGGALDWRLRFLVDPRPDVRMPIRVGEFLGEGMSAATRTLAELLDARTTDTSADSGYATAPVDDAVPIPLRDEETLLQACWVLSLLTEVYRAGPYATSPLGTVPDHPTVDQLLDLAPAAAVDDLQAMTGLARSVLVPELHAWGRPVYVGPTFDGSQYVHADADLIAGGVLLEVKATIGQKRKDGSRYCGLDTLTLHQVLGYAV